MPKNFFVSLILCVVLLITLTACNNEQVSPPDLTGDISLSGTIQSTKVNAEVNLTRTNGVWTAEFTAPDSVKGLKVTCDNGKQTVTFSGLSFDYKNAEVPFTTAVQYITCAADAAADVRNISVKQLADGMELIGSAEGSGYNLTVNAEGKITSISAGGCSFTTANAVTPPSPSDSNNSSAPIIIENTTSNSDVPTVNPDISSTSAENSAPESAK